MLQMCVDICTHAYRYMPTYEAIYVYVYMYIYVCRQGPWSSAALCQSSSPTSKAENGSGDVDFFPAAVAAITTLFL